MVISSDKISLSDIIGLSKKRFGDMVKAVVDIETRVVAFGGELHADEEQVLLDRGSKQNDLWGINIYHELPRDQWIEFDSMINIRPSQRNLSRGVEDEEVRRVIVDIVNKMITD
ncbi:hypothetical protein KKF05_04545 [Patescibacteria group bacterium]|nr:hypothetical protein [Patescibacteria group bacterium]MBU1916019.1 hypothetical protein [Patescibacteria group bacterium]